MIKQNINKVKFPSWGTILGILFIVLKLCNVINWSWVWVLAPFWISAIIVILALVLAIISTLIAKKVCEFEEITLDK